MCQLRIPERIKLNKTSFSEVVHGKFHTCKVNKQDFFQVFQGSGIATMEDNLASSRPLSYTNGSRVDLDPE